MNIIRITVKAGRKIPLTRGLFTTVDEEDFARFGSLKWYAQRAYGGTFYAARRQPRKDGGRMIWLHKEISGAKATQRADHVFGNTLDNRRFNLRVCTNAENGRNRVRPNSNNTSNFKGVFWHQRAKKWMAQIKVNAKAFYLGLFKSAESAAKAYDEAAIRFHGKFASLNFKSCQ